MANWLHVNTDHVVDVPTWDYILRILQFLMAVANLGLAAFQLGLTSLYPYPLTMTVALCTLGIVLYYLVSVHVLPFFYNYGIIMLIELGLSALWISCLGTVGHIYSILYKSSYATQNAYFTYINVLAALLAFTVVSTALQFVSTLMYAWHVYKHFRAGLPLFASNIKAADAPLGRLNNAEEVRRAKAEKAQYEGV